ncbi:MAG: hypothetical protein R2865_07355 [Deinococcales bacterium]
MAGTAQVLAQTSQEPNQNLQPNYVQLPASIVSQDKGQIQIHYKGLELQYDHYFGWQNAQFKAPLWLEDKLYVPSDLFEFLGFNWPALKGVRYSQGDKLRLVFDLADNLELKDYEENDTLSVDHALKLTLPPLEVPLGLGLEFERLKLDLEVDIAELKVFIYVQETLQYHAFSLKEPSRFVIDFWPIAEAP